MNDFLCKIFEIGETGIVYTYQTGRFPYRSSQGNTYIMVAYHYEANVILVEPIKNRQAAILAAVLEKNNNELKTAGVAPKLYITDNDCSDDLKATLPKVELIFQLVLPHIHRSNKAERVIQRLRVT